MRVDDPLGLRGGARGVADDRRAVGIDPMRGDRWIGPSSMACDHDRTVVASVRNRARRLSGPTTTNSRSGSSGRPASRLAT